MLFKLSQFYFKMHQWFIFKNRGRGSIWSTSCFLPCPQTRAVKTFLWNLWQADMQRLSVTGAQRTQVQIFLPCFNSCAVLSQRMKVALMWTSCVGNPAAFTPCWTETIPSCKGENLCVEWWQLGQLVEIFQVSWDSNQDKLRRFGVLICLAVPSAATLFRTWVEISAALNTWSCKRNKSDRVSHGWGNFLKGHIWLCNSLQGNFVKESLNFAS